MSRRSGSARRDTALVRVGEPCLLGGLRLQLGATLLQECVHLAGIGDQAGGAAVSTTAAKLKGDSADPAPPLGFSGAAMLDRQGRLVGMVGLKSPVIAIADPTNVPQAVVVPARAIRAFLHEHKLVSAAARNPGVGAAKASLLRVICVRK